MLGIDERVLTLDIELIKADIMQEHVNTAKVIGGDVDLLTEKADLYGILAQNLFDLE